MYILFMLKTNTEKTEILFIFLNVEKNIYTNVQIHIYKRCIYLLAHKIAEQ